MIYHYLESCLLRHPFSFPLRSVYNGEKRCTLNTGACFCHSCLSMGHSVASLNLDSWINNYLRGVYIMYFGFWRKLFSNLFVSMKESTIKTCLIECKIFSVECVTGIYFIDTERKKGKVNIRGISTQNMIIWSQIFPKDGKVMSLIIRIWQKQHQLHSDKNNKIATTKSTAKVTVAKIKKKHWQPP